MNRPAPAFAKTARRVTSALALVVLVVAVFKPSATTQQEAAQLSRPYFSQKQSYFARGNFINLDTVADARDGTEPTSDAALPAPPDQLWTVAGTNTVSLNWTRQPRAEGYVVKYRPATQGVFQTAEVTAPFFSVRNARADTTYEFTVASKYADDSLSTPSPVTAVTPTALTQTTQVERHPFEVGAWLPPGWENPDVQNSFDRASGVLTSVNPFWYNFSSAGKLEAKGSARNPEVVARAHQAGMQVVFTVTNNYDPARVKALLKNREQQQAFIEAVVTELTTYDYDGVDLDFENVRAADKEAFTEFVIALSKAVHIHDKTLELTAQAKKSDGDTWDGPGAVDLGRLEPYVDRFKPMLYDHARPDTAPGPLAPLSWIREVLTYWKSKVPAEKIQAALPLYGYDWSLATDDDIGIQWQDAEHIKRKYSTEEQRDPSSAEMVLQYADEDGPRTVFYQDVESVQQKVAAVRASGVEAVTFWLLGGEDPQTFGALRSIGSTTTVTVKKPLNIGLKLKGQQMAVTVSKPAEVAEVTVLYGSAPDQLTERVEHQTHSLIDLPDLAPGETRYVEAIAFDGAGQEIQRSGTAYIKAE